MAISSSLATKAGAAGTITAGSGLVGTYYAWDHITLYAVEREVINKDIRLTVGVPTGETPKKITVSVDTTQDDNVSLGTGYTWTCEITIDSTEDISQSNLNKYIQSHLQIPKQNLDDTQKHNKKLLVKACAKDRETKEDKNVKGRLTIKKLDSKFTFKDHSYLDFLLQRSDALYEVEKKVIDEKVVLEVKSVTGNESKKQVKIKTVSDKDSATPKTIWNETDGYWWECTITAPSGLSQINDTNLGAKLPITADESDTTKLKNKQTLVKKCSKNRGENDNAKKVQSTLDFPSIENVSKEDDFFKHLFDEK